MKKMSLILLGFLLGTQGAFSSEQSLVIGKRKIVKNVRNVKLLAKHTFLTKVMKK